MFYRESWVEVDLDQIKENIRWLRRQTDLAVYRGDQGQWLWRWRWSGCTGSLGSGGRDVGSIELG